jgi:hypothetical protein
MLLDIGFMFLGSFALYPYINDLWFVVTEPTEGSMVIWYGHG